MMTPDTPPRADRRTPRRWGSRRPADVRFGYTEPTRPCLAPRRPAERPTPGRTAKDRTV